MTSTPKTEKCGQDTDTCEPGSGHRGSLRGANKLARRARSFKDDLLERISNMRSPGQHPPHLTSGIRSHSPLSPKLRNMGTKSVHTEDGETTPAKELQRLVKEVTVGLKHFSDVITKRKLEMLPDNGTLVFESIADIHKAIKPYCVRSPPLMSSVKKLCTALAMLIRLCDEIAAVSLRASASKESLDAGLASAALSAEHVSGVVRGVTAAVEDTARLAQQHLARPALAPRPALVSPRASAQRNSLPDIPLTPKERSLLTGEGSIESVGVRASHSSESVLDAPDSPPPKPARPIRKIELAPPLPPKRKSANDNSLLASSMDRLSLQSHSSSLDSMLNVSNEDDRNSHEINNHDNVFISQPHSDIGLCAPALGASGDHMHTHFNNNRFSNESGFVSVDHAEISTESHHYTSHTDSTFDSTDSVMDMRCTLQTFESHLNVNMNVTTQHYVCNKLASITSDETETPPELPAKIRKNRADIQQNFPNVEIRPVAWGGARPHTLAEQSRPPPLPLKKKHIMAYMEMFGNCSHPPNLAAAPVDMFRHSIHTSNFASTQQTNVGNLSVQRHEQVQRSIAQSYTVQHFGTPQLSGSSDSVCEARTPPALPPKLGKRLAWDPPPPDADNNEPGSDESYVSTLTTVKFPVEVDYEMMLAPQPSPSPVPSQISESSVEPAPVISEVTNSPKPMDTEDIILQTDISQWLLIKTTKDGPEVRGGHPDALVVLATKATKDFAYQEAFLATYRTWTSARELFLRLTRRARHVAARPPELRCTLALLTRLVADLTMTDLEGPLMQEIMDFIYWLVETEELPIAKALRQILVDKQKQLHSQLQTNNKYEYESPCSGTISLRCDTILDFKATELAEQMTLMDEALFSPITTAEVLSWSREQPEELAPNLTRFTAHFNKMSYWARSRILQQEESREREKYANKFMKVMKVLLKIKNFNSLLALVSALDSPPVQRLGWSRAVEDAIQEQCTIINSSSSFRRYRQALAQAEAPCIPYLGLVLQDLTFVHIGNPDLLPDGSINFTKRFLQYYNLMENMKRFQKKQYKFSKNERIQAMFGEFEDVLSEEVMWQLSESIKPRGRTKPGPAN